MACPEIGEDTKHTARQKGSWVIAAPLGMKISRLRRDVGVDKFSV